MRFHRSVGGAFAVLVGIVFGVSPAGLFALPYGANAFAAQSSFATVAVRIKVPRAAAPNGIAGLQRARPQYVSAATKSFVILTDGHHPVVANVDVTTGYASVDIPTPAGTHTFAITAYDLPGGSGKILSTGTTAPVSVPVRGYVYVHLTLEGVVAGVALSLAQVHATIGSPAAIDLRVSALDADGNTIIPETVFTQPITLTTSDPVNGKLTRTLISTAINDDPGYQQRVSVLYSGAGVSHITFSATGAGLTSVVPATLEPIAPPVGGAQIIASGTFDPNAAFSTSPGHQLLATFGVLPQLVASSYGRSAVDAVSRRVYVAHYSRQNVPPSFDIFQTGGAYALVDSFNPGFYPGGMAIDGKAQLVYVASTDFSQGQRAYLAIFSTASGHALITRVDTGAFNAQLAVDPVAHRLYAAGCGPNCGGTGVQVYDSLTFGRLPGGILAGNLGSLAVDPGARRLYAIEYALGLDQMYVDAFDTATFARVARIGPLPGFYQYGNLSIDPVGRRLYLLLGLPNSGGPVWPYGNIVNVYGLDSGLSLIESFEVTPAGSISVAPYSP